MGWCDSLRAVLVEYGYRCEEEPLKSPGTYWTGLCPNFDAAEEIKEGEEEDEEKRNGVKPGVDFPGTLFRSLW